MDVKALLTPPARDKQTPLPPHLQCRKNDLRLEKRARATGRHAGVNFSAPGPSGRLSQLLLAGGKSNKQKGQMESREEGRGREGQQWDWSRQPLQSAQGRDGRRGACRKPHLSWLPPAATCASASPPPRLIICPPSIYGPLSGLSSLRPHTHPSKRVLLSPPHPLYFPLPAFRW